MLYILYTTACMHDVGLRRCLHFNNNPDDLGSSLKITGQILFSQSFPGPPQHLHGGRPAVGRASVSSVLESIS